MSDVTTERRGRVLLVTLDRPKANAIDAATSIALGEAFRSLQEDDTLSVGIVTGGGERFFSAGWDLKAAAEGEAADAYQGVGGFAGLTEYWDLTKPVIAAVNGLALGGGFELALAADMIVAADHAEFALPEATIGVVPDSGGVIRLPRRLPRAVAMEMLMTGRRAGAEELHRWGVVNTVVPADRLMDAALELANRVAASAPLSLQAIKEIDRATDGLGDCAAFDRMRAGNLSAYGRVYDSEDAVEGIASVSEKRDPVWKGR
ncbi:enoyl-CoA hydratase-related protein [Mameliella sp. AT18]|uniref:enoyl-CoA hydratase-related protein n=1 Tax=Mameliella sp. AT18 TaxID=3028385 RepID=UPI00084117F0|nr:enoyl-CoA hydratase-related protein [Mameliella sp. AT18]MDD9729465.1 enoyl-CoA hydratase-related protein [Mameliella sp. AT18]ODM48517.1 carnitinyl-CoA dehydratase [Ruegeria sp. PBVC088]